MTTTDVSTLEPLEPNCEWRRDDLADGYVYQLTDAHVAELDAALVHAESVTDDVLDITRESFPLPTLGAELDAAHARAHRRARCRAHPRRAGRPVRQGTRVEDLLGRRDAPRRAVAAERQGPPARRRHRPGPGDRATPRRAATRSAASRSRSTPTAPTSSACSASTRARAAARASSPTSVTIHNELVRDAPELAAELYEPFPYDFRGEQAPGTKPLVHDADLQPAAATGCSCATSGRTSSRRAGTRTRPRPSDAARAAMDRRRRDVRATRSTTSR